MNECVQRKLCHLMKWNDGKLSKTGNFLFSKSDFEICMYFSITYPDKNPWVNSFTKSTVFIIGSFHI